MTNPERRPLLQDQENATKTYGTGKEPAVSSPQDLPRSIRYGILLVADVEAPIQALNTTLVATLLPSISSDFNKSHQASWLGTAYLLATCTFTPLYGRLCNVMGRRAANQTAVYFAAIGTAMCGLSSSMEMLIAARSPGWAGEESSQRLRPRIITCDMYSMRGHRIILGTRDHAGCSNCLRKSRDGPGRSVWRIHQRSVSTAVMYASYTFAGIELKFRYGWRCAFLLQLPLFAISLFLTTVNLRYPTPGKSTSASEALRRIDYGGIFSLLGAVLSFLTFLSLRHSNEEPWTSPMVYTSFTLSIVLFISFLVIELRCAAEPVFPPLLVNRKVPMLVGIASFMVSMCNFAVMYNFPTWFQTVMLTSASEAGAHLIPNGVSLALGSLFAGWWMHRTGKYRTLTLICGIFPFISAIMISCMKEDSHPLLLWLGIFPLGFGNAVVLQTMLIALLAHIPESALAVGTGFSQLFRGIGQVSGVGLSAAVFQSSLNTELHKRIVGDGAEEVRVARLPAKPLY
ncbi:hypothetical protein NM688_g4846 [Phlebia brevispora]|uniref:Uncharacterized protein n=1 Tax=Phlebia brevispora TaxID=194682 RepID=A0ACC1T1H9_9APHY|nr:hypothetical protein NM688_g4846 [Phlebia brevispora]